MHDGRLVGNGKTVEELESIIQKLKEENKILRKKTPDIKEVTVLPADYASLKSQNRKLNNVCKRLTRIISSGKITSLAVALSEFENTAKSQLNRIFEEIKINDYSEADVREVIRLSEFLSNVSMQLYGQVSIFREGCFADNGMLHQADKMRTDVMSLLRASDFVDRIDPAKLNVLCDQMISFRQNVLDCLKESQFSD